VGTYYDASTDELVALMPASSGGTFSAADASSVVAKASSAGLHARVQSTAIAKSTVDEIQAALAALWPSFPQKYSYGFYFDPSQQKVVLQSDGPASLFATVMAKYSQLIKFSPGFKVASRHSDAPPHWGGAVIVGPYPGRPGYLSGCTTGFAVTYKGTPYMLTAGHCFDQGASTYNGPNLSGYYMGYVSWRAGSTVDAELIYGSSYSGLIYTSETAYKVVLGAAYDPAVNSYGYCTSGITTGTHCDHTVLSNTAGTCYAPYGCLSHLTLFNGTVLSQGDSGGPFYLDNGSSVSARAMDTAEAGNVSYAEPWSQLSSYFGISIIN
jgi:hypothetical protein